MKRVAIYARVSTADQSTDAQLAELREYARNRKFTVVKEYVDVITGNRASAQHRRRGLQYQELVADARRRKFDIVLVWAFDRFARSVSALIGGLELFRELGVDFVSITQAIDTTTTGGRLLYTVTAAFSEFEREMITARVRSGIANARAKGVRLGRPRNHSVEWKIDKLRSKNMGIRAIAKKVGRSPAGVLKILGRLATERTGGPTLKVVSREK